MISFDGKGEDALETWLPDFDHQSNFSKTKYKTEPNQTKSGTEKGNPRVGSQARATPTKNSRNN